MKKPNSPGSTMKALRESTGLTQQVWADLLDTTRARIGNYEIDKYKTPPSLLLLARIAADKIARAGFFKKVDAAVKAANAVERSAAGKPRSDITGR